MARHLRNPKIESRTARAKLKPSGKPSYFDLGGKLHLGYRRGKGAGVWVGRRYLGGEKYHTDTLAQADDLADANGGDVLNFVQAQHKARAWSADLDKQDEIKRLGPVITVAHAIEEYVTSRRTWTDAKSKLRRLAKLGEKPLAALTVDDLVKWRNGLLREMSEASARRVAADARACLNAAAKLHSRKLPALIRDTIRDGLAVPRGSEIENNRQKQILSDADVRRLVDAAWQVDKDQGWGGDLGRMVLTLAATGARLSQIQRLRVADLDLGKQRLIMPVSRKGKGDKETKEVAIPIGPDVVAALEPSIHGRRGTDPLLLRPRWRRVGPGLGVLQIYERSAWRAASELTKAWKAVVARAGLPKEIIPYALRHSSMVRGLRAGLPTQLVGRLHDTSPAMLQKNYTRFIVDAMDDLARAAVVPLMPVPVTPIRAVE